MGRKYMYNTSVIYQNIMVIFRAHVQLLWVVNCFFMEHYFFLKD